MLIETWRGDRAALLPLFELADDSPAQVAAYIGLGEVLVALEAAGSDVLGHLQLVGDGEALEIKSMAVIAARRGEGIGRALVEAAIAGCRARGAWRLTVSTAAADTGNLRFYQRQGFRMLRIVRDAFGPATGYAADLLIEGIPLRDQVVLDLDL